MIFFSSSWFHSVRQRCTPVTMSISTLKHAPSQTAKALPKESFRDMFLSQIHPQIADFPSSTNRRFPILSMWIILIPRPQKVHAVLCHFRKFDLAMWTFRYISQKESARFTKIRFVKLNFRGTCDAWRRRSREVRTGLKTQSSGVSPPVPGSRTKQAVALAARSW